MCCFLAILSGGQGDKQKAKEMIDFCNADGEVPNLCPRSFVLASVYRLLIVASKKPKLGKAKNALPQKRGKLRGIRGGDPAIC